jgi:type II secretory ATPase GspE/PulE/Tfp pilus assembly ATPase PilB-like protein
VLSSIHTNDAPSAINRLVDMDVAPYVASSALVGVVAQRLVRRLCVKCRKKVRSCDAAFAEAGVDPAEYPGRARLHIANPKGCDECGHTGYRGRIGLFEIMEVDDEIRRLFLSSASTDQIRAAAISAGMKTLRADALEKVIEGITSLEEMRRVVV